MSLKAISVEQLGRRRSLPNRDLRIYHARWRLPLCI
jgi:hypothetical protein